MVDDSERQRERGVHPSPQLPPFGPAPVKNARGAAVNYSRRKQSAFPEGFGEYDAVISAYLNSLTTAIKTQIQSATSCLVKSCL